MKQYDTFCRCHPAVSFIYFAFVIGFTVTFRHPVCQTASLVSAALYAAECEGRSGALFSLKYALPVILLTAIINPAFNHEGVTVLCYLPLGNPLTAESIFYGISSGVMFASVLLWFLNFNRVFTTDKTVYLFGRILPSLSLLISMTVRFVPRFRKQLDDVRESQKGFGVDTENGSPLTRMKNALRVFSVVVTWSLENSVETADSMKSRGFGLRGRTSFSVFTFTRRDRELLFIIAFLGLLVLCGAVSGAVYFRFYPSVRISAFSPINVIIQASYFLLCLVPVIMNRKERAEWNAVHSKM